MSRAIICYVIRYLILSMTAFVIISTVASETRGQTIEEMQGKPSQSTDEPSFKKNDAAALADEKDAKTKEKKLTVVKTEPQMGKDISAVNNPRTFALGLNLFKEHGFGLKIRARYEHFALDLSAGVMPWLVIVSNTTTGASTKVLADVSIHSDIGTALIFNDKNSFFQNGLKLGGIYDTIGGFGGMLGWFGEFTHHRFVATIGFGVQVYPYAHKPVLQHFHLENARVSALNTTVQVYFGASCFWYIL